MDDVLSKLLGYLLAIFVFIMIIIAILTQYQGAIEDQIQQKSTDFINDCRETGQVTPEAYARISQIITTYGHYNVNFKIERRKEYSQALVNDSPSSGTAQEGTDADAVSSSVGSVGYISTRAGYETIDTGTDYIRPKNERNHEEKTVGGGTKFVNIGVPRSFIEVIADGDNYKLKAGDRIYIKVTEGRGNFVTRMKRFLFHGGDTSQTVLVNYGGEVGN